MKIGVTLASGHLGRAIIDALLKKVSPENIVAFARTPSKIPFDKVSARKGDYDNPDDWATSLTDVDVLILISSISQPDKRIEQHKMIINAAKNQGVKKIIYNSIIGSDKDTGFAPIVRSNRHTEQDVIQSGIPYIIGRNGLYIDPDVEFIDEYKKAGCVWNCAGDGKCCYTSRAELALAYTTLALNDNSGHIFNLCGAPYTQQDLVDAFNLILGLHLVYKYVSVEEFKKNRSEALGEFYGTIIGGIYESIAKGYFDVQSDYYKACGLEPQTLIELIRTELKRIGKI